MCILYVYVSYYILKILIKLWKHSILMYIYNNLVLKVTLSTVYWYPFNNLNTMKLHHFKARLTRKGFFCWPGVGAGFQYGSSSIDLFQFDCMGCVAFYISLPQACSLIIYPCSRYMVFGKTHNVTFKMKLKIQLEPYVWRLIDTWYFVKTKQIIIWEINKYLKVQWLTLGDSWFKASCQLGS